MEVASLYREPPREQERATAAVEFHDVFRIYRSGPAETVALRGLDLRIEAGAAASATGAATSATDAATSATGARKKILVSRTRTGRCLDLGVARSAWEVALVS